METKRKEDVKKAAAISTGAKLFEMASSERLFNQTIERMQLKNASADFSEEARDKRIKKFSDDFEAFQEKYKGAIDVKTGERIVPASNWKPLADLFNKTLAHLTEKSFTSEIAVKVGATVKKAKLHTVTKEQENVIIAYFTGQAQANWDKLTQLRVILESKGVLNKSTKKATLPTEAVLIAANNG